MVDDGSLVRLQDAAALPDFRPEPAPEQKKIIDAIEQSYREAGAQAKNRTEMLARHNLGEQETNDLLGYLFATGRLVKLSDENFFHKETYDFAVSLLADKFRDREFSLAEFRDELGSARKAVQALLEYFDTRKYTMRKGDVRVAWKLPQ